MRTTQRWVARSSMYLNNQTKIQYGRKLGLPMHSPINLVRLRKSLERLIMIFVRFDGNTGS